jgi:eukaryotic-like serine/threonine-protein kinase
MSIVTICPEDRVFRTVLLGDASLELELDLARHMTGCERCATRMHAALANEQTRKAIQKRGEDRPLWQFYSDASKLTGSAATVRRDDGVEATLHLPKNPSKPPSKEIPLASGGEEPSSTIQLAGSIYSFLSPPETNDEIGRLGGYCITKLLGAGGMGMVFQAEDIQLRRRVALKVMRPEVAMIINAHDRFLREARTMAQIEHDHVVAVFQVGEERGVPFMAMPFLQGMSLDTVLKKNPTIPLMISLRIGFQVANGLAAAHSRGLIHRDIKPANIWIETQNNNRVKLLDFGLARGNDDEINLTQSGAVLGTPAYMAPEQAAGGVIDARADLFSLGVVLYELTTGKRPFAGTGTMAILTALAIHSPSPPHEVNQAIPENISAFIMRLLEKDPENRVSSAQEAAKELANLIKAKAAEPKESPIANDAVGGGNLNLPTIKAIPRHKELSPPTRSVPVASAIADASGTKRRNLLLAAMGSGVLGLLVMTFAVITIFMRSPYGTLEVQIDDPSIEARFKNGSLVLTDDTGKVRYTLRPAAELADKNEKIEAGNYKLRVEGADGLTVETDAFSLKNGKREIVKVILKPNPSLVAAPPIATASQELTEASTADRIAAEYVLSVGGKVGLNDQPAKDMMKAVDELPQTPFRLTRVEFHENDQVSDAGLECFKNCDDLTHLVLFRTSHVTDAGVASFSKCKNLVHLDLYLTPVTDLGLSNFKNCKNLNLISLGSTAVTDEGLANFKDCAKLQHLHLFYARKVTDAGLAHFAPHKELVTVNLSGTKITDSGLIALKNHSALAHLYLSGAQITDTGLLHLHGLKVLQLADLKRSKVTEKGIEALKHELPKCKIMSDFGELNPAAETPSKPS